MSAERMKQRRSMAPARSLPIARSAEQAEATRVRGLLIICEVMQAWFGLRSKRFVRKWRALSRLGNSRFGTRVGQKLAEKYRDSPQLPPASQPPAPTATFGRRSSVDERIAALEVRCDCEVS